MLLSEIGNKEIVDLSTGCSHGELWNGSNRLFEKKSGKIKAVLVPSIQSTGLFQKAPEELVSASLEQHCHHRRGHDHFSILSTESLNQIRFVKI